MDDKGGKALCALDSSMGEMGEYEPEAVVPAPLPDRFEDRLEDDTDDRASLLNRDAAWWFCLRG